MKEIILYTDGACSGNPGPGGYGVVLMYKDQKKELSGGFSKTTNNRMEILGVIKGLESLKEQCHVMVYSDSKYVVDAIEKGWVKKWEKNNWMRTKSDKAINSDLWKRLLIALSQHKVKFNWVKGHANNEFNERCDFLARNAIENGTLLDDLEYLLNN